MSRIVPVILSGGSGTRLWPLSRSMYPKQFIRFFDGQVSTFFGTTLLRLKKQDGFAPPVLLCNSDHRFLVRQEIAQARIEPQAIFLEPAPRNTAPAIAVAALAALDHSPDSVLAVMPSDHVIADEQTFVEAVRRAAKVASLGHLVLFGIVPSSPHTGYGYIRRGAAIDGSDSAFRVEAFVEKPDPAKAKAYLAAGSYYWNSGIFVLHAATLVDELARLHPDIVEAARASLRGAKPDLEFVRLDAAAFNRSPSISIDYAVMEQTAKAVMLPLSVGWNDVGSWSSLWDLAPRDGDGNFARGDVVLQDSRDLYVDSERSLVAAIGVKDLVIVDTADALLVADRRHSQDVSKIVARLKQANRSEADQLRRNYRPWGFFESLATAPGFQVKLLHVNAGGKLSLQRHRHRSEHWIVVRGIAKVTVDAKEQTVQENESVYISATQWHRLENPGGSPLEIIEVQIGNYLGEDDIERADDVYGRSPDETR